jgi:hypothetical protein
LPYAGLTDLQSYVLATFIVQPVAHLLGRYAFSSEQRNTFPLLCSNQQQIGYSGSKGRHLSLFFSGLLHCAYFLIAACSPRYSGVLSGFFIGGVGKSVLIGESTQAARIRISNDSDLQLRCQLSAKLASFSHSHLLFSNVFWTTNPRLNGIALLHGIYGS